MDHYWGSRLKILIIYPIQKIIISDLLIVYHKVINPSAGL